MMSALDSELFALNARGFLLIGIVRSACVYSVLRIGQAASCGFPGEIDCDYFMDYDLGHLDHESLALLSTLRRLPGLE
jgi:hypothetical protein